jgi:hypothetical protein
MMATRPIQVSTDVFAAIWADRKPGEDSEEQILRRKFSVQDVPAPAQGAAPKQIGFSDPRYDIELEEGFEIFRTYRGTDYRATAMNGGWILLNTGDHYRTLNQLSSAIGAKTENAWKGWYFVKDGKRELLNQLRGDDWANR